MSRYDWEKGEFKLPSAEWAKFKATVRDEINSSNALKLEIGVKAWDILKVALKGKKGHEYRDIAYNEVEKLNRKPGSYSYGMYSYKVPASDLNDIVDALIDAKWVGNTTVHKLKKPTKKDFPQYGNNVTKFHGPECVVAFDNDKKMAYWQVYENNHAVETARDSTLGKAFFAGLKSVKWARGTGGQIRGNDEYNSDSGRDYAGSGGSYVTLEIDSKNNPLVEPARRARGFGW